jgi:hypothetical protein
MPGSESIGPETDSQRTASRPVRQLSVGLYRTDVNREMDRSVSGPLDLNRALTDAHKLSIVKHATTSPGTHGKLFCVCVARLETQTMPSTLRKTVENNSKVHAVTVNFLQSRKAQLPAKHRQ